MNCTRLSLLASVAVLGLNSHAFGQGVNSGKLTCGSRAGSPMPCDGAKLVNERADVIQHPWVGLVPMTANLGTQSVGVLNGGYTAGEDFSLEKPAYAVKLILQNTNTSPLTLPAVVVATTANFTDYVTPTGGASSFVKVTCNSGACTVPAAPSAGTISYLVTDPIPLTTLAPTDGTYPHIMTRVLWPSSGTWTVPSTNGAGVSAYVTNNGGRLYGAFLATNDCASSSSTWSACTSSNSPVNFYVEQPVAGVVYETASRVITMESCGDSLTSGYLTNGSSNSYSLQASLKVAADLGVPVSVMNIAYPGQAQFQFVPPCLALLNAVRPEIVTIPADSPNDYTAVAGTTPGEEMATALSVIDAADLLGVYPMLLTPLPYGITNGSSGYGPARSQGAAMARTISAHNAGLVDAQQAISGVQADGVSTFISTPAQYLANDGAHLNDAGDAVIAALLAVAIEGRL